MDSVSCYGTTETHLILNEKEVFLQGQETPIENLTHSNY